MFIKYTRFLFCFVFLSAEPARHILSVMIWSMQEDDRHTEKKFKRTNSAHLSIGSTHVSLVVDSVRHRAPGECAHQQNLPDRKHESSTSASGINMATYSFFSSGKRKSSPFC